MRKTGRMFRVMAAATAVASGCMVVAVGSQRDQLMGSAADRDQITAIVTRWETAWNTHDMTAYASLYHDDGVWVLWTGEVWTGRRAIEDGHAAVQWHEPTPFGDGCIVARVARQANVPDEQS